MNRQHLVLGVGVVALCVVSLFVFFSGTPTDNTQDDLRHRPEVSVVLTEKGFSPDPIRVSPGTNIVFTANTGKNFWPASNPHPQHTAYAAFDPREPVAAASSWSFVVTQSGVWGYHDHLRPYLTGTIYVEK